MVIFLNVVEDFEKVHAFDFRLRMKYEHKKLSYYQVALGDETTDVLTEGGVYVNGVKRSYIKKD